MGGLLEDPAGDPLAIGEGMVCIADGRDQNLVRQGIQEGVYVQIRVREEVVPVFFRLHEGEGDRFAGEVLLCHQGAQEAQVGKTTLSVEEELHRIVLLRQGEQRAGQALF